MADTSTQIWRTNYKSMSRQQLLDEQARMNMHQFTDKAERLELLASELLLRGEAASN